MKAHLHRLLLASALATAAIAADAPKAPATFFDALSGGKPTVNVRIRYETVDQTGFKDADALTVRTRLGYGTLPYYGFKAYIEGENISAADDGSYYKGTGPANGYATIADPELTQVNQAWLNYTYEKTSLTVGRQKIILNNARFVGDVGWRQNDQTFDAALLQDKTVDKLTLTYAYLNEIHRVFDDTAPQLDWESDSHLFNASYAGLPFGTLTGYAYLLDFAPTSIPNSTQTYGLSFAGAKPVTKTIKATYRLEYANQSAYGDSALNYNADYYAAELGGATKSCSLSAGYEKLGSDNGVGFKTPLATLHAFDGWADVFLLTPAAGLTDTYVKATATIPGSVPVALAAVYHTFGTDKGPGTLGDEIDLSAAYKYNKNLSFLVKYAKYSSDQAGAAFADRTKVWLETDLSF